MKKKIIIVDDEKDIRELVGKILSLRNYETLLACNGDELFRMLETHQPDLIILDVMMPGSDGYEICGRIKQTEAWRGIPVMLLTVLADPINVRKGKDTGAASYLIKPFEPHDLEKEVDKIFGQSA